MKFRDNLLHLRQQRNMTQEQLAMLLGVSRQSVAKWESGQSTPEVDKLMRMAELFDCTLDELISSDLSNRSVQAQDILPEGLPPQDICGYDPHAKSFAFNIATGVGIIIAGFAFSALASALASESLAEIVVPVVFVVFVALGLVFILPASLGHAAFAREHPYVEDFYTPEQKRVEQRSFTVKITLGIVLILVGVIVVSIFGSSPVEELQEIGAFALLALVAIGVWLLVDAGIYHGFIFVENYNKERADEQWEKDNPKVGRVCAVIMLIATVVALVALFAGSAAANAGSTVGALFATLFWVAWIIGGIGCAIATTVMKAKAGR